MATQVVWTFSDVLDHLLDHMGGTSEGRNVRMSKRSILSAYRNLSTATNWSYYYKRGRVTTVAAYDTGTVTYDHTGGSNEREVTLVTGTFPSWAARGIIRINNIDYGVSKRVSDTVVTLSINNNPGEDVTTASSYTLARDSYTLPLDFQSANQLRNADKNWAWPTYVAPGEWLKHHESKEASNDPRIYTYMADPDYLGAMAVFFYPPPSSANNFDFVYQRTPHPVRITDYKDGTLTGTAGVATLTGKDATWTQSMVGSIVRIGTLEDHPDGIDGLNPYQEERVITSVDSATSITVDQVLDDGHTNVKYRISDPLDIEQGAMFEAFLALAEARLSILTKSDDVGMKQGIYAGALRLAMQADNRDFSGQDDSINYPVHHLRDFATVTPNS